MTTDQYLHTLSYRIRIPVVLTYLGQLLFVVSLFSLVTLLVAILTEQYDAALRYSLVIVLLGGLGFFSRNLRQVTDIQPNEALVITSLAFLVVPALMAWPMMTAGISYGDALFESISAVTTTGLSTVSTLEDKPMVFLFSRAWMQWVGGLGIVILTLAILSRPGMATR
ncbi:MAG: TrkH family potassium uptake protein, partial [candidate division Zixibacteria bacterium]|nr:TrkH family potassium uptake protein [candidate division Zixibacteria bacterium]